MTRLAIFAIFLGLIANACIGSATPRSTPTRSETVSPAIGVGTEIPSRNGPPDQLLYVRRDNSMWLYTADGSGERQISDGAACPDAQAIKWAPDGSRFAARCNAPDSFVVVMDAAGRVIDRIAGDWFAYQWSPDSRVLSLEHPRVLLYSDETVRLRNYGPAGPGYITDLSNVDVQAGFSPTGDLYAFFRQSDARCAPGCLTGLVLRDLQTGTEQRLGEHRPVAWVLNGSALLALANCAQPQDCFKNDAFLIDVSSGHETMLSAVWGHDEFWTNEDGSKLVVIQRVPDGIGLAVLDAHSLTVTPILGSSISYPSDHIPHDHVAIVGDSLYWLDATSAWYRASLDASGLRKLGDTEASTGRFSADGAYVALVIPDMEPALILELSDGVGRVDVARSARDFAWRPPHPSEP